jgi:ATP-dependent DNA helicase 2 subunit 2
MADKEATVYILDVGSSMGRKHHNRQETDLDWAMRYVWDKVTSTVCDESIQRTAPRITLSR